MYLAPQHDLAMRQMSAGGTIMALFVDGGSVAEKIADLKARWGVGAGVRYNSPVGPLRLDLAYGVEPRAWRLHFNVGFTF